MDVKLRLSRARAAARPIAEDEYEDYVHTRPLMYDTETTLNHYVFEKNGGLSLRLIKI